MIMARERTELNRVQSSQHESNHEVRMAKEASYVECMMNGPKFSIERCVTGTCRKDKHFTRDLATYRVPKVPYLP